MAEIEKQIKEQERWSELLLDQTFREKSPPVSYTHLTLPTICSV